jgi:hypothetical protein
LASFKTLLRLRLALKPLFTRGMFYSFVFNIARSARGDSFLAVLGIGPLHVRDELGNIFLVNIGNHTTMTQVTLALAALVGQDVAGKSTAAFDAARSRFFETLGSAPIGLDFWHLFFSFFAID